MSIRSSVVRVVVLCLAVLGAGLIARTAQAEVKFEMIEYMHAGQTLQGILAVDDAIKGKRPGILLCHEWWGCNDNMKEKAGKLAKEGYIAFALDMYGKGNVTTDPKQASAWLGTTFADPAAMRARAGAGLKILTDHALCDASRVAATGYCMGGTVALELARTGATLKAVVCFHTSNLSAKVPADNAKIKARVLVCNGADDEFIKADEKATFMKQMKDAGIDHQFIEYGGAVHAFTNAKADSFKIPSVGYNKNADERSWKAMKALFDESF
ncbi:MAG: dienelactone hydrolase family protein [Phycisphaerales bacterium]